MVRWLVLFLLYVTPASADLKLKLWDGNPYDRLSIYNDGCAIQYAELTIDFATSKGEIILDTVRGGPGTKDPMPVKVERGPIKLAPVADGDSSLTVLIGRLATGKSAVVTMDMDDTIGWWDGPRVSVDGDDVAGTQAVLRIHDGIAGAVFNGVGQAVIAEIPGICGEEVEPGPLTIPIG